MIVFETPLKKLKYLALKEVALLVKDNKLTQDELRRIPSKIIKGDVAEYRCCVYREKAIVYQRAIFAAGYKPIGDFMDELCELEGEQVIHVISSACDRCPVDKYNVTEACRGCLQHKCMEVCPAHAITRVAGRAYIDQEACKECGMCKKVCPYNAIAEVMRPCKKICPTGAMQVNEEDKRAVIEENNCIQCGACMAACPFGAISDKSYIVPVVEALRDGKKVYALAAPAIAGQFGPKTSVEQIKTACKKVGFYDMVETACGADAVTVNESNEFVKRMNNGDRYMTTSCCPGFFSYVEKKYPTEASRISSTVSPMVAIARLIKNNDRDAVVVFIGPCTAKKAEVRKEAAKGYVDYALTFEEIAAIMGAFNVDPEECEAEAFNDASVFGRGFAQSGGVTSAIQNYITENNINIEFNPAKASGGEELKKVMMLAKAGKLNGNFIEGMMCEGGCIGGPATMVSTLKSRPQLIKYSNNSTKKSVLSNEKVNEFEKLDLER